MIIFARFAGIGDALFVNTIATYKSIETGRKIWIGTNHKAIFQNNKNVVVIPVRNKNQLKIFLKIIKLLNISYDYTYLDYYPLDGEHILSKLSKKTNLSVAPTCPIFFGNLNINRLPDFIIKIISNKPAKKIVLIQSGANTSWTNNKSWYAERFYDLSSAIYESCIVVQVGLKGDPTIKSHFDIRDKLSIGQLFSLMKNVDLFIGTVGFLMHAAATVGTQSIIIYGGFEAPWESGYEENVNIYSSIECAPCWKTICTHPTDRYCMKIISSEEVISIVKKHI